MRNGRLSTTVTIQECGMLFQAGDSSLVVRELDGRVFDWHKFNRGMHPTTVDELQEAALEWCDLMTTP